MHFACVWYTRGMERKAYPSDVSDDEWAFMAPYLTLMREDAPQREHSLREVCNGLRHIVRTGMQWRMMPCNLWLPATCRRGIRFTSRRSAG